MTKKKLLCTLLVILLLFACLVPAPTQVSAAKKKVVEISSFYPVSNPDISNTNLIVESGEKFYIGDMISVKLDENGIDSSLSYLMGKHVYYYTSTEMGATYVSDHPEILAVEENSGYAETKEPGKAIVTLRCQDVYASFPVTVVEKGTLSAGEEYIIETWNKAGRKLAKKIPEKLTVENGYDLFNALKAYVAVFAASPLKEECRGGATAQRMLRGWNSSGQSISMAPACSCFERAYSMMIHYIAKYHPMCDKKYWTAKDGQYFTVSATKNQITLKMKKNLTKQALLALYLNEFVCKLAGWEPDGVTTPLAISTVVQKDRLEACSYIAKYKDADERYTGHTVTLFKLRRKTATVTHVYRSRYNPTNARHKHTNKKKLNLKKGKKYWLRIDTMNFYWPGEFVVK